MMIRRIFTLSLLLISSIHLWGQGEGGLDGPIYTFVDQMPSFPETEEYLNWKKQHPDCCMTAIDKYIQGKYPPKSIIANAYEGKLYLEFIVEKDGSLSNISVIKNIVTLGTISKQQLEKAAITFIERMNENNIRWEAGKLNGNVVRVKMLLPISYK